MKVNFLKFIRLLQIQDDLGLDSGPRKCYRSVLHYISRPKGWLNFMTDIFSSLVILQSRFQWVSSFPTLSTIWIAVYKVTFVSEHWHLSTNNESYFINNIQPSRIPLNVTKLMWWIIVTKHPCLCSSVDSCTHGITVAYHYQQWQSHWSLQKRGIC